MILIIVITKTISIETHRSIDVIEKHHVVVRRIYAIIKNKFQNLNITKKLNFQLIIKIINNRTKFNG